MRKTKAQLRHGLWPDSRTPANLTFELTPAARERAKAAIKELGKACAFVNLDRDGKARFHITKPLPSAAYLLIERCGDLIESYLIERATTTRDDRGAGHGEGADR
jgi:hypothetical protein